MYNRWPPPIAPTVYYPAGHYSVLNVSGTTAEELAAADADALHYFQTHWAATSNCALYPLDGPLYPLQGHYPLVYSYQCVCPFGSTCTSNAALPAYTPPGYYSPDKGASLLPCPAGHFCPVGTTCPIECRTFDECPEGSSRPTSATSSVVGMLVLLAATTLMFLARHWMTADRQRKQKRR